jgi:hypothetical protein
LHAEVQQRPSAQKPEAQTPSWRQAAPGGLVPTQVPFSQVRPVAQSAGLVHRVRQAPPGPQWYAPQPRSDVPSGTGTHCPGAPPTQRSHTPSHEVAQQTPSTHRPLSHCVSAPHAPPSGAPSAQVPLTVEAPLAQGTHPPATHWLPLGHTTPKQSATWQVPSAAHTLPSGHPAGPPQLVEMHAPWMHVSLLPQVTPTHARSVHSPSTQTRPGRQASSAQDFG